MDTPLAMAEITGIRAEIERIAAGIAAGDVEPRRGAGRIWVLLAEADYPEELHGFRVGFVGPLSEWQDHPEDGEYDGAVIVEEARRMTKAGPLS